MSKKCAFVLVAIGLVSTAGLYGQKKADFSNFVVTGDSLTAGYQSAQLIETGQVVGYANVIAKQAGTSLNLPLIPAPGFPQIDLVNAFGTNQFAVPNPLSMFVLRSSNSPTKDLAVPGFTVEDYVWTVPKCVPDLSNPLTAPINIMASEILLDITNPLTGANCTGTPLSQMNMAVNMKPSTAIMWIGNNDALFSVLFGIGPTPLSQFAPTYHLAASTMASASKTLVIANLPDISKTAYLLSVPKLAALLHVPVGTVMSSLGLN
ncbi:MAG: hypothetical protein JO022_02965, partial [Acidobacteriaceae bacterium]|nr:hypothetical protein [Acidobacteriaceae bacterium]